MPDYSLYGELEALYLSQTNQCPICGETVEPDSMFHQIKNPTGKIYRIHHGCYKFPEELMRKIILMRENLFAQMQRILNGHHKEK